MALILLCTNLVYVLCVGDRTAKIIDDVKIINVPN